MNISEKQKEVARWAVEFSLSKGCSAARASIITANSNSFEFRDTKLDKLQQSDENKLFLEIFVEGCYGTFSTNRIHRKELEQFIAEGIVSTRFLTPDTSRQLPDPARYYAHKGEDLDLVDKSFESLSTAQKIDLTRQTVDEIQGSDSRIISVTASYGDGYASQYTLASNGFEAETSETGFSITAEVALKTDTDARPESYWYDSTIYWHDLQKIGIAQEALKRTIAKIGQQKIKSGKYQLLLDNTTSSRLLSPIIGAMYGMALHQKSSFLVNKLQQQIAASQLTVYDRPHQSRSFGARWFDGEGVATFDQTIIQNGILNTYFIDTQSAIKLKANPTIAAPSILEVELGTKNFDQLVQTVSNGIWVTAFNGGNCNSTTGDFSFGVEGFLIRNGQIAQAIGEMNITGNMLTLWEKLVDVGNDPRHNTSRRVPSLLFADVSFSGL